MESVQERNEALEASRHSANLLTYRMESLCSLFWAYPVYLLKQGDLEGFEKETLGDLFLLTRLATQAVNMREAMALGKMR